MDAYHLAMREETDAVEWQAFTAGAVKRFGWKFLPTVPDLIDALHVFRGAEPVDREAVAAYDRVLEAGTYSAEGGTVWNYRTVAERCGRAAADAFLAAGGHHAFATTWDEAKRRERFLAAYQEAARSMPADRLLPAGAEAKQLPPPAADLPPEQAREVLRKIIDLAPESPRVAERPRLSGNEWSERVRALREQAARIGGDDAGREHAGEGAPGLPADGGRDAGGLHAAAVEVPCGAGDEPTGGSVAATVSGAGVGRGVGAAGDRRLTGGAR